VLIRLSLTMNVRHIRIANALVPDSIADLQNGGASVCAIVIDGNAWIAVVVAP